MTPRTVAFVACVVMCCAARARAQASADPSPLIEWSAARPLTTNDFKGKIPLRGAEASLSFVAIEASWECEEGSGASRARAVFDPRQSWWRKRSDNASLLLHIDEGDRGLLAHEQRHFDLTELWARKVRDALKALPEACRTPGASATLKAEIDELEHKWQDEQARYDKETRHGTDQTSQSAWAAKTAAALREPRNQEGALRERRGGR